MLDAIRAPLALGDLAEDAEPLVKEFVNNAVFGLGLQIFKSMLMDELAAGSTYLRGSQTWTTSDPVSWHARDAHFPFNDLLTLDGMQFRFW